MTKEKLYGSTVTVDEVLSEHLKTCYMTHMVVYNDVLAHFRDNRNANYKELKLYTSKLLDSGGYGPVIKNALYNAVYYMYKRREFRQKLITAIQYITIILNGYTNPIMGYDATTSVLWFKGLPGYIHLSSPLPEVTAGTMIYLNLSYSNGTDQFEVSVFTM